MPTCKQNHRFDERFLAIPFDQGGLGRHHCCGCAYDDGYDLGLRRETVMVLDLERLPKSQAGTQRHRSPHYAFALGYMDGIRASYGGEEAAV